MVEELLKSGKLPCLVATSSLELGIDMGALDLVIQVESPKSVARGLQRIGRAGHQLDEVSKGRIFPKFRADLLECAVVAKRMRDGRDRGDGDPAQPARRPRPAPGLDGRRRRVGGRRGRAASSTATEPFSELSREQLENVLDMLDGRYPSERFAELRPRLVWDRTAGTVRGRKGARQLAVTNAGTIPDRGLYGVHLPDGRRVGELDEEMVYEARPGQTFLLGATTWRIEDITRDRVIVTPAPGVPGAVPFWRGDGVGRPPELGRAIGAFAREAVEQGRRASSPASTTSTGARPRTSSPTCASSRPRPASSPPTRPSSSSASATRSATGGSACSRRSAVACTPPGASRCRRGSATSSTSRPTRSGPTTGSSSTCPTPTSRPTPSLVLLEPDEVEDLVVRELGGSALFGARFRENAARSLLIPRAYPGKRTPLWQQRLQVAEPARGGEGLPPLPGHPRDLPRVPARRARPAGAGRAAARPPLAQISPGRGRDADRLAVRLLAALRLRRHLHVRGRHAERRAPGGGARPRSRPAPRAARRRGAARADRPGGARRGRGSLQQRHPDARAKDRDALQQILRRLGDLTRRPSARQRTAEGYSAASMLAKLERERRAVAVRIAGEERWIAAEDAGLYRDALGVPPPAGPARRLPRGGRPTRWLALVRRYARTHGPFPTAQISRRYGVDLTPALRELERAGELVRGELLPGGTEREWCDSDVLRRRAPREPRRPAPGGRGGRPGASWRAFCPPGRTSTPTGRRAPAPIACARRSSRYRASRSRPRSGSATSFRAASAPTARPGSTS